MPGTRRPLAILSALTLLAGSLVAGVALAPSASAACTPTRQLVSVIGDEGLLAKEDTRDGTSATCDGDNIYRGRVFDARTDGRCAYAYTSDGSSGPWTAQGVSCTTGAWANYTYTDPQANHSAYLRVCAGTMTSLTHVCVGPFHLTGF